MGAEARPRERAGRCAQDAGQNRDLSRRPVHRPDPHFWGAHPCAVLGRPKEQSGRKDGRTDQVAVLAGVLGAAACAFSWARFSSHSAFFLARRSRLRRAVRGSCGLPIVGGCLAEVFRCVALKSSRRPRKRARARVRARKSSTPTPARPALAHASCREATPQILEKRGRAGTGTFTGGKRSSRGGGVFFE